jgi:hypothetical protein
VDNESFNSDKEHITPCNLKVPQQREYRTTWITTIFFPTE